MSHYRPTWAQINLKNLDYNFCLSKKIVGPKVRILVPVKADGYGHGIVAISKRLAKLGVDYLGVASIDEGIVLRNAGIKTPILILSAVLDNDISAILDYQLTPAVCRWETAYSLNKEAKKRKLTAPIHIKVDTGMHRIGVAHNEAYNFVREVARLRGLNIEGIFTHFPCADNSPLFTKNQIKIFNSIIQQLEKTGIVIALKHCSNSLGVISYPEGYFNMVRPGLMIYGLYPKEGLRLNLKPLLTLKTKVVYLKSVSCGSGIGYGHTYIASKQMRIATLPIGYGDGYPRNLSNKAHCLISGKKAGIIGSICMDQLMVDVTGIKGVEIGQEAVLVGAQKDKRITVEYLAKLAGTIPYEIVCNLGNRIRRAYSPEA